MLFRSIADILYGFGEERFARRIASHIAKERKRKPIETTTDLIAIIKAAVPDWYTKRRIHFATNIAFHLNKMLF